MALPGVLLPLEPYAYDWVIMGPGSGWEWEAYLPGRPVTWGTGTGGGALSGRDWNDLMTRSQLWT